uniref:hypothetical protein n=1 Tax=Thiolapillus sp. TaxID=2017437 RepID=UPI003AF5B309
EAGIEASREAGIEAGIEASKETGIEASIETSRQAGIKAQLTKKENNKKLKRSDLDPTPPAQQSWRNLPPVLGTQKKERKQEGNPPARWREV